LSLLVFGCAATPRPQIIIHETPAGSVSLEHVTDKSFQAAHPIKLDPSLIARILGGVLVKEEGTTLRTMFGSSAKGLRALSEAEVAFLTPHVASALSQAAPDEQVVFRLNQVGPPTYKDREGAAAGSSEPPLQLAPKETTAGTIYAYGKSLHVTLTQYHAREERADTINVANRRLPETTGLERREVLFEPEIAVRSETYETSWLMGEPAVRTLIIDYDMLAKVPPTKPVTAAKPAVPAAGAAAPTPGQPPSASSQDVQALKEMVTKKDQELEKLKKDVEELKRQQAGQQTPKQQKPTTKKKATQ
jgi:hypothetical protein